MTALDTMTTENDPILFDDGRGLVLAPRRRRDGLLARLRSASLDERLADGAAPESDRLLAARAAQLTTRAHRDRLARRWDELVVRARSRRPQAGLDARIPIARTEIDVAADEIAGIAELLRSPRPLSAAGVAVAGLMLTDARSPVYRVGGSDVDFHAAVARALATL
jgi:hypothetical protein